MLRVLGLRADGLIDQPRFAPVGRALGGFSFIEQSGVRSTCQRIDRLASSVTWRDRHSAATVAVTSFPEGSDDVCIQSLTT